jgi:hypothetical protein
MRQRWIGWTIVCAAIVAAAACGGQRTETMASPSSATGGPEGTVAVTISQVGSDCKDENRCAGAEALRALMFVGVPGSTVRRAMVADEKAALAQHAGFFRQLFEEGGYARYVQNVRAQSAASGSPQNKRAWTVVVNYEALRTALEKEGIIRKFGY